MGDAYLRSMGPTAALLTGSVAPPKRIRRHAVVMGFGRVGGRCAHFLRAAGFEVIVYDKDPAKRLLARRAGFVVERSKRRALPKANVLVSVTGGPSIRRAERELLPPFCLAVNGASADEFRSGRLKRGPFADDFMFDPQHKVHVLRPAKAAAPTVQAGHAANAVTPAKMLFLAKDGGVVNFPSGVDERRAGRLIPGRYIQLELGLLYWSMLEAESGNYGPGLHHIPLVKQRALVRQVQKQLKARGESLRDPVW